MKNKFRFSFSHSVTILIIFFFILLAQCELIRWSIIKTSKILFVVISTLIWLLYMFFDEKIVQKLSKKISRKFLFGILLAITMLLTGTAVYTSQIIKEYKKPKMVDSFENVLNSLNNSMPDSQLTPNWESVEFENRRLGNTNANLIAYGKFLNGDITCYVRNDGKLVKIENGNEMILCKDEVSYLNRYKNKILFRKDEDRNAYILNLEDNIVTPLLNDVKVGEMIVFDDYSFYVNYTDHAYLHRYNLITHKDQTIISKSCTSFALLKDKLLVLEKKKLNIVDLKTNKNIYKLTNVKSFSVDKFLYIYGSDKIIKSNLNFRKSKVEANHVSHFIGKTQNGLVYETNKGLIYKKGNNEKKLSNNIIVISAYEYNNNLYILEKKLPNSYS